MMSGRGIMPGVRGRPSLVSNGLGRGGLMPGISRGRGMISPGRGRGLVPQGGIRSPMGITSPLKRPAPYGARLPNMPPMKRPRMPGMPYR